MSITMGDWKTVQKQPKIASWFEKSHGTDERLQFFIGAGKAVLPNWDTNANPIESFHNTLGDIPGVISRAAFTTALEVNVPLIFKDASVNLCATGWRFQPPFVPYEMALTALERLDKGNPYMHSPDKMSFKVLSRRYWAEHPEVNMDTDLLVRHARTLNGIFPEGITKKDAQELATCIHTVAVDPQCKGGGNPPPGFRCDCKKFVHIGLCSCSLMVAQAQGAVDLRPLVKRCARGVVRAHLWCERKCND